MAASPFASVLIALFVVLLVTAKAKADCTAAQHALVDCVTDYDVDYSRLSDPAYLSEFCSKSRSVLRCMREAEDDCPNLDSLVGGGISRMAQGVNDACPAEGGSSSDESDSGKCPQARANLMSCVTNFDADYSRLRDPSYLPIFCRESREFMHCVQEEIEECPELMAEVGQAMGHMTSAIQRVCPAGSTPDSGTKPNAQYQCPDNERQFMRHLHDCLMEVDQDNPCRTREEIRGCVARRVETCEDEPWMNEEALADIWYGFRYQTNRLGLGHCKKD